jgi:hypothetical protein
LFAAGAKERIIHNTAGRLSATPRRICKKRFGLNVDELKAKTKQATSTDFSSGSGWQLLRPFFRNSI